jgi:hypothetical protein
MLFGGYKAVVRPDPIPNSAVKRSVADGSACIACARVGSRQILLFSSRNLFSAITTSPIRKNYLPVSHQLCREIGILNARNIHMKKAIVLAVLTATAAMCFTDPATRAAEGAKDKSAQTPGPEGKQKQMPFRGKVSAVDKTKKTVTLEGKSHAFQITSATKITKAGKPAVIDDVIVGQTVGGLAKETAAGKWELVTLNTGAKAGKDKDAEKKGENK